MNKQVSSKTLIIVIVIVVIVVIAIGFAVFRKSPQAAREELVGTPEEQATIGTPMDMMKKMGGGKVQMPPSQGPTAP
jgi:flagellar basal body-associated protein FliL